METRLTVIYILFTVLFLGGVFFIFPSIALAEETSARHAQLGTVIIDRYAMSTTMSFTNEEREWMQWGIEHEGIPARALHHEEQTWAHDNEQQSVPVYEGVYTWEQGIADYAHGEKQRALTTLGHLLHLVIDAHPTVLSSEIASERRKTQIRTWRDVVAEKNAQDMAALLQEGADTLQRFFAEAQSREVQRPNPFTVFFTKAFFVIQERVGFARTNIQRAFHGIRIAFARVPPPSSGGVVIPKPQIIKAHAEQEEVEVQENKKMQVTASVSVALASPPLATSVPLSPPMAQEQVSLDIPVVVVEPIIVIPTPQDTVQQTPEPLPPPSSPPPHEELDVYGFPIGTVRTFNRVPPETTLTIKPEQLTNVANATFAFVSSKEGTFFCTIDNGEEQTCTSPITYDGLFDGNHTFAVRARDIWGTYDATPETYTWTIDTISPETMLTSGPIVLTNSASATFVFASIDEGATFGYTIDGGEWQIAVSPLILASLTDGEHTVTIRARDLTGNTDPTPAVVTWTIDTTPPSTPTLTNPTTNTTYTTIATTVTIVGTREDGVTIAIDGSGDGIVVPTGTTWEKSVTLALGTTTFSITATDAAGNVSVPTTLTITRTENHAPTTISNLVITTPITANDHLTLTWAVPTDIDTPSQTLTYLMRYATTPIIDETSWGAAMNVMGLPAVGVSGTAETFMVIGLTPAITYYFALRTSDGDLISALSNNATGTTHYGVRITDAHFQGSISAEYMTIKNERSDSQNLQGWKLHDVVATPSHTYTFGAFTLAAGATVMVHTGAGINTQTDLYWNSSISIWNDTGGDTAFLKDSGGMLIDSVSW